MAIASSLSVKVTVYASKWLLKILQSLEDITKMSLIVLLHVLQSSSIDQNKVINDSVVFMFILYALFSPIISALNSNMIVPTDAFTISFPVYNTIV